MTAFCVDTLIPEADLRAHHGVLRAETFAVTTDARKVAAGIVQRAREEADAMLQKARDESSRLTREAEEDAFARARVFLQALDDANRSLMLRAEDIVIDLAQAVIDSLIMQMTPRERLEAALRRVLHEAPPKLASPLLRVHPDDVEHLPEVDWEVRPDPGLSRGTCRLEAASGEWFADYSAAVAALKAALGGVERRPPVDVTDR